MRYHNGLINREIKWPWTMFESGSDEAEAWAASGKSDPPCGHKRMNHSLEGTVLGIVSVSVWSWICM